MVPLLRFVLLLMSLKGRAIGFMHLKKKKTEFETRHLGTAPRVGLIFCSVNTGRSSILTARSPRREHLLPLPAGARKRRPRRPPVGVSRFFIFFLDIRAGYQEIL